MDIEKKTKLILSEALHYGASDVHFIPRERGSTIRFRVYFVLIFLLWGFFDCHE